MFSEKTLRHLLKYDVFSDLEKIEALELFGAYLVIENNKKKKAVVLWNEALELRYFVV